MYGLPFPSPFLWQANLRSGASVLFASAKAGTHTYPVAIQIIGICFAYPSLVQMRFGDSIVALRNIYALYPALRNSV